MEGHSGLEAAWVHSVLEREGSLLLPGRGAGEVEQREREDSVLGKKGMCISQGAGQNGIMGSTSESGQSALLLIGPHRIKHVKTDPAAQITADNLLKHLGKF